MIKGAELSPELQVTNPFLSIDRGMFICIKTKMTCPETEEKLVTTPSCPTNGRWLIEGFSPLITPCAECPVGRNNTEQF